MPKTNTKGQAITSELPSTLRRSSAKAQRTFAKAHDSAVKTYGEGERSRRTAYSALKHSFEKVGDHWEAKDKPGPSDPRAKKPTAEARKGKGETFGGVDVEGNTRQELMERAKKLGIRGVSGMGKQELARAIQKKQ
jgi:hypothetical protein